MSGRDVNWEVRGYVDIEWAFDIAAASPINMRNVDIARYSAAFAVLAGEIAIPYLDLFTPFSRSPRYAGALAAYDRVHPADDGYAMIAEHIAAWQGWQSLVTGAA